MKVAVFTPYLPYPPDTGGKIRSYYLLRALTQRFEVDLYTPHYGKEEAPSEEHVTALRAHCRRVILFELQQNSRTRDRILRTLSPLPRAVHHFSTADSLKQAEQCLQEGAYDALIADEICMTPYAELAPGVPILIMRQKIDSSHYERVAQARRPGVDKVLDLLEARQLKRYEKAKMPLFQAYLACSEDDAAQIRLDAPDLPGLVVANGADLSEFTPSERPRGGESVLLYVGTMDYYPNLDAVRYYFQNIHPDVGDRHPGLRVHIVGHNPTAEIQSLARLPGVIVTGTVPDVRPYYQEATALIVPLRLGGGTRLKIVEAMAMGVPVISTTVGAEGLDITPGENILIADDPSAFSDSISMLLADADLHARIAKGGRQLAQRYDWREITRPWVDLVERLAIDWKRAGT